MVLWSSSGVLYKVCLAVNVGADDTAKWHLIMLDLNLVLMV